MRKNLIEARKKVKMTQHEIAGKIGIQRTSYTNIERGNRNPSIKVQKNIRYVLKNESEDLFLNE